jgi:hypothetical protein
MNTTYKVEQSDLIGAIENFPIEVVEKMIERQVEQGNKPDVKAFRIFASNDAKGGGFTWENTIDGQIFWDKVIADRKFNVFFEMYPKNIDGQILNAYENFNKAEAAVRDLMKSRFAELLKNTNWEKPMVVWMDGYMVNTWIECDVRFEFDGKECEFDDLPTHELFQILERMKK